MRKSTLALVGGFVTSAQALAVCPSGTDEVSADICRLQGTYVNDLTLTSDKIWLIKGGVFIGKDNTTSATLSIQKGTVIKGESGRDYLVINRGSKINAKGTASEPIVFTSDKKIRGGWGGLIINGNAPINGCAQAPCEAEGEGSTGVYGGSDSADSSGVLQYVRVEYAGFQITPENELNGIAFQGVGEGTLVENIQVHMAADDGLEFFGGTVNIRKVVITGARDDSLDWVNGWQGRGQYIVIKQSSDEGNNGIEADNLKANNAALPRSNPSLSNVTLMGTTSGNAKGGSGLLLRRGTGLSIYNSIISGFKKGCIDLDDTETFENASNGGMAMQAVVVSCSKNYELESGDMFDIGSWFLSSPNSGVETTPTYNGVIATNATTMTTTVAPEDFFFDEVDFVGAIRDANSDWTKGWTVGL